MYHSEIKNALSFCRKQIRAGADKSRSVEVNGWRFSAERVYQRAGRYSWTIHYHARGPFGEHVAYSSVDEVSHDVRLIERAREQGRAVKRAPAGNLVIGDPIPADSRDPAVRHLEAVNAAQSGLTAAKCQRCRKLLFGPYAACCCVNPAVPAAVKAAQGNG